MKKTGILISVLFLLTLAGACSDLAQNPDGESGYGSVSINAVVQQQGQSLTRATVDIGTLVTSGNMRLTRGNLVRYATLTISGGQATAVISDMLAGPWQADVQLYDANNIVIYSGSVDFNVISGGSTSVVTVPLTRHEGDALFVIDLPTETIETDPGMTLWNKLGSAAEVANSVVGPGLRISSVTAFAGGRFGGAITIQGSHSAYQRIRNVAITNLPSLINAEQGAIECYYFQASTPTPLQHNPHRIFDGGYGYNPGISLQSFRNNGEPNYLRFTVSFGGTAVYAEMPNMNAYNGRWVHLAAVWSRYGIATSGKTLILYINGTEVASATDSDWGNTIGNLADIGGANDNCAGVFRMDNLKVYNYAKTSFNLTTEY